ncbi:hypothetical protein, partial [Rhizobium rhizogenes]|uniref:hypothetical protein n=1 Tax=Rhizobium rhizogenes TaxID=359 RepID=UPI0019600CBD
QQGADFAHERLIGTPADLSHNPGKFQLPLAQNRGAPQMGQSLLQNGLFQRGKVNMLRTTWRARFLKRFPRRSGRDQGEMPARMCLLLRLTSNPT